MVDAKTVKRAERKTAEHAKKLGAELRVVPVELVDITSIKPNKYNPNRQSDHDFELLERSILEDGFTQPILVNRDSREIVDGEHRWRKAKELGFGEVPVAWTDMTPEQMRVATLRHNRARGSEDLGMTAELLRDLEKLGALGQAQESLMLSDVEIQRMIQDVPAPEALAGEEFSAGWEPESAFRGSEKEAVEAGRATDWVDDDHGTKSSAMTPAAQDQLRDREKAISAAKTAEERQSVARDMETQRVSFSYTEEEVRVIRAALGESPAARLLEICTELRDGFRVFKCGKCGKPVQVRSVTCGDCCKQAPAMGAEVVKN